ncbi:WAT1-related protein At2g39510-like [Actinidia eriantha]|uniref:WAT1-related protein At2g39510-like n=1 Tax=Actinidia eriantha TaxID=165200 RepID=UPI00258E3ACD|nr:WAT1-related protein At2g39510-like [Actinidia eriantha]
MKSSNNVSRESSILEVYDRAKPYLAVILVQLGYAGLSIIAKFGLNHGMSHYTFAVYRNVVATLVFAPFAFFFERTVRPRMTKSIFFKIMLLGLLEPVLDQNLYYAGMKYTTATFAAAMSNVLPAITFLMALIFRLEKVNMRRLHSQAKVVGTLVTVGGAMIMVLIKGAAIALPWTKVQSHGTSQVASVISANQQDPIKGSLVITAACFCWAAFYIVLSFTLKAYPAALSLTTLICMMGSLQGTILTFVVEKGNTAIWSLTWDTKLLAAIYGGIMCSGVNYYISGVVMKERGPVFVTAFNPLGMVFVAIMGSFMLAEEIYMGRLLGAIVIVIGLYLVIWGKSRDENLSTSVTDTDQQANKNGNTETSSHGSSTRVMPNDEAV